MKIKRSIQEINEKIKKGKVRVLTADEMTELVKEEGPERAAEKVDVVTTGTFGAMCSSGVFINFGHSEPPIKMTRVWLNDVEAYTGIAAVDAYLGATQPSRSLGIRYGGAHVIEDLLRGRSVRLRALSYGTDCYPRKRLETEITLEDLNQAIMCNPRNSYQRYTAATNSSSRTLYTYMGKLLPNFGNATFSGAGQLSPLINDPDFETIGPGTRILLGGGEGFIIGSGTQHLPEKGFATLMVVGDLKKMSPEFVRAAVFPGYGCTLYLGIAVPIPILHEGIAAKTGISDEEIKTVVLDYGVPSRDRPVVAEVTYAQLRSGSIEIKGKKVPVSPLSSLYMARKIARRLKELILSGKFLLSEPAERLSLKGANRPMAMRRPSEEKPEPKRSAAEGFLFLRELCIHCGACLSICRRGVFYRDSSWKVEVREQLCNRCGLCNDVCPVGAIHVGT